MPDEIAVLVGIDGQIASIYERGRLLVYRRTGCQCNGYQWEIVGEKEFTLNKVQGIKDLREQMTEAIDFMGECRVFVAMAVAGVPYFELEKSGFTVWEVPGLPSEYLDQIVEQESQGPAEVIHVQNSRPLLPVETFPGCYRISLLDIQQNNTRVTSKQVLLPFLRQEKYISLEILCDHVPPWLEAGIISGEYNGTIENCGRNIVKVTISQATP